LARFVPGQSESVEVEQVRYTVERDAAPQGIRGEHMKWTAGCDVPLRQLAHGSKARGVDKPDPGAIDVHVLIRVERVKRGTQQWGCDHVDLAPYNDNRHAVDMKSVNLHTLFEHCHCH
jgi:hypothetical protein